MEAKSNKRERMRQLNRNFLDAIVMRNKEEVRRLLMAGANVDAKDKEHGKPAIMLAAELSNKEIVELLISEGAKVDERDDQGRTALFLAEVGSEIFANLLASGADINAVDHSGNTILMQNVSRSPSLAEVEELLNLGIDPDVRNEYGESALDLATSLGLVNVIERLKKQPAG
jgi:ankyrin repeat protein